MSEQQQNGYCNIYFKQIIFYNSGITFIMDIVSDGNRVRNLSIDFPFNIFTIYDNNFTNNLWQLIQIGGIEKECEVKFMDSVIRDKNKDVVDSFLSKWDIISDNTIFLYLKNKK